MSYWSISQLGVDIDMAQRVQAASAEQHAEPDPWEWTRLHLLELAALPGWSEAYDSAVASGVPHPGRDEAVITDPMILAGVQLLLETPGV